MAHVLVLRMRNYNFTCCLSIENHILFLVIFDILVIVHLKLAHCGW
jgi:hypothetical protein